MPSLVAAEELPGGTRGLIKTQLEDAEKSGDLAF